MKIVIIEDERLTASDLVQTLQEIDRNAEIVAVLKSVREGKAWFATNDTPDLIFSDIQLGDGLSFEIFGDRFVPVIFCTAYDEYALNAFNANGIDYILKPFTTGSVATALRKYKNLTSPSARTVQMDTIKKLIANLPVPAPSSLLIHYRDTIQPVHIDNIALFELVAREVRLLTFDQAVYYPGKSLDELEQIVGEQFFRVNRQFLVHRRAIVNLTSTFSRKLSLAVSVPVSESITISKEKAPLLLKWLSGPGQ